MFGNLSSLTNKLKILNTSSSSPSSEPSEDKDIIEHISSPQIKNHHMLQSLYQYLQLLKDRVLSTELKAKINKK